jgi:hypothetical protein
MGKWRCGIGSEGGARGLMGKWRCGIGVDLPRQVCSVSNRRLIDACKIHQVFWRPALYVPALLVFLRLDCKQRFARQISRCCINTLVLMDVKNATEHTQTTYSVADVFVALRSLSRFHGTEYDHCSKFWPLCARLRSYWRCCCYVIRFSNNQDCLG